MKSLREMVLAHSSYARAAGLQTEISRQTVGRVAGNEVEYKRQMNLFRKDMMLTISNVRREEKVLKKSMRRYHRKKRQNKIERRKREQEDLARDKRTQDHLNVIMVWKNESETKTPVNENKGSKHAEIVNDKGNDVNGLTNSDNKDSGIADVMINVKDNSKSETELDFQTHAGGLPLPAIVEDEEQELKEELENEEEDKLFEREDSGFQELTVTPNETIEATSSMSISQLPMPKIKPKKQVVSYADIIKLQHTSNTKRLFNLVNLLAKKHGVAEENTKPKEIRNNSVLRGNTSELWTDSILRSGAVFYPMKYGYLADHGENSEDISNSNTDTNTSTSVIQDGGTSENNKSFSNPSSKDATPLPPLTSRPNSQMVDSQNGNHDVASTPQRLNKRNKSMPIYVSDFNKTKRAQSEKQNRMDDYSGNRHSTQSTPSFPRKLDPINKSSSTSDLRPRSDSMAWHEALGLLKGVHSLNI